MEGATLDTRVRFAVLGPLEVRAKDGRLVEIGGRRVRALLTLLLLDAGRVVSTDALVAGVWDDRPPSGVGNALQALVSRLRAVVDRDLVVGGPSGYRLAVSRDQVDVHVFTRLAREGGRALAAGEAGRAATALREALALWRGTPLADLPGGEVEVARLEELRVASTEDRVEADLLLGRHGDLVPELSLLTAAHPLRERLRGQLMRALYGSGRHVEALAAYEEAREAFADRLGTDPSPALSALHLAMLRRDPALFAPSAAHPAAGAPPVHA
ncbi:AfsR/SARP family transcriptional regulator, partial [Microbispora sp. ATCC PTA-5024]|uniref:AfsR/SARP family transcriptional regulator n=1 Tax=Microbispora sp. ATCC PTA-5024 TaxID=316330 RepID=UPI0003DC35CA